MSGPNPYFVDKWREGHFDPYKEDRERAAAERAISRKLSLAALRAAQERRRADPKKEFERALHHSQAMANKHSVTLPKLKWTEND
jgi:hypothetical protein